MRNLTCFFVLLIATLTAAIALSTSAAGIAQSADDGVIQRVAAIEDTWRNEYAAYFDSSTELSSITADQIDDTLEQIGEDINHQFGLLYIFPHRENLELVLVLPDKNAIQQRLDNVPQSRLEPVIERFSRSVQQQFLRFDQSAAQQLYDWMIRPFEAELHNQNIETIVLCVGQRLRSLPFAALHDGETFLVENYGLAIIPAFSLTELSYQHTSDRQILAMGASEFQVLQKLPAVPLELDSVVDDLGEGDIFLNQSFTLDNLQRALDSSQYSIVHLATHAAFRPGVPEESYIQLWQDETINLSDLQSLGWRDRPVDLLVLSACQTALGDPTAELGFAGISFHSGVRTTLASLWQISDLGTLALMREFYWQLTHVPSLAKTSILRQSQLSMIHETVTVSDSQLLTSADPLALGNELVNRQQRISFADPYFWAGFVMVGSPW
jgi:CHAT domain-containing protein